MSYNLATERIGSSDWPNVHHAVPINYASWHNIMILSMLEHITRLTKNKYEEADWKRSMFEYSSLKITVYAVFISAILNILSVCIGVYTKWEMIQENSTPLGIVFVIIFFFVLYSCCSHLDHKTSVKVLFRFSLLILDSRWDSLEGRSARS
jgi:hypothetical protein